MSLKRLRVSLLGQCLRFVFRAILIYCVFLTMTHNFDVFELMDIFKVVGCFVYLRVESGLVQPK